MTHEFGTIIITRDECTITNMGVLDMASCDSKERHALQSSGTSNNLVSSTLSPQKRPGNQPVDTRDTKKKSRSRTCQFLCQVPKCQEKFRSAEYLEAHMRLHEGVEPFVCSVCGIVCKTESKLTAHIAKHTVDKEKLRCSICERNFSSVSAVRKHKRMQHKPKPHICSYCNAGFQAQKYLEAHIKRTHEENLSEEEEEEEMSQSLEPSTSLHPDTASPNRKEKDSTDSSTTEKDDDFQHPSVAVSSYQVLSHGHSDPPHHIRDPSHHLREPSHHLREQSNPSQCGTHQMTHEQLDSPHCNNYHLPQDHVDSHDCGDCGSIQLTRKQPDLPQCESRMKRNEVVVINCELCTSTFPNMAYLEQHMAVHLNERIVGCPNPDPVNQMKCQIIPSDHKAFTSTNGSFGQFMAISSQPAAVRGLYESSRFMCVSCNEQFSSLGSLKRHEARVCTQTKL